MITIAKVTSAEYYTSASGVAAGRESYYTDATIEDEPPGVWRGSGAQVLGLTGEVEADDMHTLFNDFTHPQTGVELGRRPIRSHSTAERIAARQAAESDALPERQEQIAREVARSDRKTVIGWDATFALAKSVTIVHTAAQRAEQAAIRSGDREAADRFAAIRSGIEQAMDDANNAAIATLEDLVTARVGGGSGAPLQWVKGQGLVVGSFRQHINRAVDPHLHEHNVILNRVLCEDGVWRAIDGQDLLAQRYAASAVADRVLMERMARMGFEVGLNADGTARELTVVPTDVHELFSARTTQVNAALRPLVEAEEERLQRPLGATELARLHRVASRSSRAAKTHDGETRAELLSRWHARLMAETGRGLHGVAEAALLESGRGPVPAQEWSPSALAAEAIAAVASHSATWNRAKLMMELELRLPTLGLQDHEIPAFLNQLTDAALARVDVVQVSGLDAGEYAAPSATRYAAAGTLAAEAALRAAAVERGRHALDAKQVAAWIDQHAPGLGADQRAAVEGITTSDAALTVLVGPAGTGKSYTAGALAGAWSELTGGQGVVFGLATSEVATKVLMDDGIDASLNISQWLKLQGTLDTHAGPDGTSEGAAGGQEDPELEAWRLGPRDVVMVDEASMVSTAHLDAIRSRVDAAGARLILTGDPRQLAAVEAGGVMGLLDGHAETYSLSDVRRFREEWEREASLRLRDGDPDALVEYDKHARLIGVDTLDDAVETSARAVVADRLDGRSVVVSATSNDLAARISSQVRDQLIHLGLVDTEGTVLGRDGNVGGVDDIVMCRRNDYRIGVTNRAQYRVLAVGDDGSLTLEPLPRPGQHLPVPDGPVTVPAAYVGEHVQLGYASTVHAAEGVTVDSSYYVTDRGDPAAVQYVGMTRGRIRNTAIVALSRPGADELTAPTARMKSGALVRVDGDTEAPTALSILEAGLDRDDPADLAATLAWEQDREQAASMATIVGRLDAETRAACRARLERDLDDLTADGVLTEHERARFGADQGTEYLSRLLRAVEQAGADPASVLRNAIQGRSLDRTKSIAQVLSARIAKDHTIDVPRLGTEIPTEITAAEHARLSDLHARAADRATDLGTRIADQAPAWAVHALGPVPSPQDAADRADWQRRAGLVAAHREAVGWDHPDQALGRMPGTTTTERRTTYAAAWQALGRPEHALTEAAMSDGQLLARHHAWEKAKASAPPNVDPALRAAEHAAEQARHAAALATAEGRHEDAAQLRAEAADHATKVTRLTEAAGVRGSWVSHHLVTRDNGEKAGAELRRRGITPGAEPDRTTATDWLTADSQARAADDTHRTITAHDIHDDLRAEVDAVTTPDDRSPQLELDPAGHTHTDQASGVTVAPVYDGDALIPDPRTPTGAHTVLPASPSAAAIDAATAAASLAASRIAAEDAHDAAYADTDHENRHLASLEAGRRRREAAELDLTTGTDHAFAWDRGDEDKWTAGDDDD